MEVLGRPYNVYENNETFTASLSGPEGATLGRFQATGTIENDDLKPGLRIGDARLAEGNAGATTFNFSGPSPLTWCKKTTDSSGSTYRS